MVIYMKFINGFNKEEIIIKNSRFISFAYYVESIDDIKDIINKLSIEYKDYTHLVYAYKFGMHEKAIDDGEPGGTAGAPILEVIKKNDLTNILIVVIRYFGGIKLGAGGLIRAYSKSAREVLKDMEFLEYVEYVYYRVSACYDDLKLLNTLTNKYDVIKKDFNEEIVYDLKLEKSLDDVISVFEGTNIKIKKL